MPVSLATSLAPAAARLGSNDARRMWEFIERFMANPSNPGVSLERVQGSRDKNVWAGRVSDNVRAILYQEGNMWTILHVDRHDDAYRWASARSVERHVKTGALQVVLLPEVISDQVPIRQAGVPDLFAVHGDDYLVSLGLPPAWLPLIRQIMNEETLLDILPNLPEEVQERLLALATGETVVPPVPTPPERPALESPDTRRRFFVLENNEDLHRMLEAPLATWIAFLHPTQRKLAEGRFNGPLKITGSAGTGKTVALHRARYLARQGKRVLLTAFVSTLCDNLERNLHLLSNEEELMESKGSLNWAGIFRSVRGVLESGAVLRPYDAVVVDEVQDLKAPELRFLAALAGDGPDCLTVVGDAGQRIYTRGLSFRALGIDVRGRSHTLRINYRTTEQIRRFADHLVPTSDDLDGNREDRRRTISLLQGPEPAVKGFNTAGEQYRFVGDEISMALAEGLHMDEIAIFTRTWRQLEPLEMHLTSIGIAYRRLDTELWGNPAVQLGAMHRAKGLEFKVVFVLDASEVWLPLQKEIGTISDNQANAEALDRERQLLYVSVTRARDEVFITWYGQPSRFLSEL